MRIGVVGAWCLAAMAALLSVGCRPTCIARGARIETPDGLRPIEDLKVGDLVLTVDPKTGQTNVGSITAVRSALGTVLRVERADGGVLEATDSHPFLVSLGGRFLPLGTLRDTAEPTAVVFDARGARRVEVRIEARSDLRIVYDLTVDSPFHDFVAEGFVVHNKLPYPSYLDAPEPVSDLSVDVITDTTATLSWSATAGNRGTADQFRVTYFAAAAPESARVLELARPGLNSGDHVLALLEGLAPGVRYRANVLARTGMWPWSLPSNEVEFQTLPGSAGGDSAHAIPSVD